MAGDASAGTATAGGDAGGGEAQQGAGAAAPDMSGVMAALQEMGAGQEELRSLLQGQQQGEGEQGDDGMDLSFLDALGDPGVDMEQVSQQFAGLIQSEAQRIAAEQVQQATAPLQEGLSELRQERAMEALVSEFPEMGDPEVAQKVVQTASSVAEAYGFGKDVASNPAFWKLTYMAGKAAEAANAEGSDARAAHIEGGSGRPGAGGDQPDYGDQIVGARRGRGALPF